MVGPDGKDESCTRWCMRVVNRWSAPVKFLAACAAFTAAVATTIVVIPSAWSTVSPAWLATRGWTIEMVDERLNRRALSVDARLNRAEVAQVEVRHAQIENRRLFLQDQKDRWEYELQKGPAIGAEPFIRSKIRDIQRKLESAAREAERLENDGLLGKR